MRIQRVGEHLHRVNPLIDETGKVLQYVASPIMVELQDRDVLQIIVGASILAIPVGFTEEAWNLGKTLPTINIVILTLLSILFMSVFVYMNFYRNVLREYWFEYIKRVVVIYFVSLGIVAVLLTLIGQCPWGIDNLLAIRRVLIVGFPASLSAALSDMVK